MNKVYPSPEAAVADVFDGATVLFGGFGGVGVPMHLFRAVANLPVRNLVGVSNHCGDGEDGLALIVKNGQIRKMITSFPGQRNSYHFQRLYDEGKVEVEMCAQGTMAERIRAGGAGVAGFYTSVGVGTVLEDGKETRLIDGARHVFEPAIRADFALIKAAQADTFGNVVYHRASRTFNPDMAMCGRVTIVEVDEIVEPGQIDPDDVHTPSIFVHRVVRAPTVAPEPGIVDLQELIRSAAEQTGKGLTRAQMAARVAAEFRDGDHVNLGVGMPTLVGGFVPSGITVLFHSENGLLGMGPFPSRQDADRQCINASRQAVTLLPGASVFRHSDSFAMIRGGHLDVAVLGGYQVSERGDLANWLLATQKLGGIGGAMDLAAGAKRLIVMMEHTARNGEPKIVRRCGYALTAPECVDMIVTDLAVIDVTPEGLLLRELAPGVTVEDVRAATEPPLRVASDLKEVSVRRGP